MDNKTLSHTTWNCKYHIVFAPKYRRKAFYSSRCLEIGKILRELNIPADFLYMLDTVLFKNEKGVF